MTKENLYKWLLKNGWDMTKQSPLRGYEAWLPGDRKTVSLLVFESTIMVQGSEVAEPDEARFEDVIEEDGKLIIGDSAVFGRLSTSPTYGYYTLTLPLTVKYKSRKAEELKDAQENAEDALYHDFMNHYTLLESTRVSDIWQTVEFKPEGDKACHIGKLKENRT